MGWWKVLVMLVVVSLQWWEPSSIPLAKGMVHAWNPNGKLSNGQGMVPETALPRHNADGEEEATMATDGNKGKEMQQEQAQLEKIPSMQFSKKNRKYPSVEDQVDGSRLENQGESLVHSNSDPKEGVAGQGDTSDTTNDRRFEKEPTAREAELGLPVLVWHGMGDTCCNPHGAYGLASDIAKVTGAPVRYVKLGTDAEQDKYRGFFGNVVQQVKEVCKAIGSDPILQGKRGFHALGLSQGGQFLRYLVETCPDARVRTLVTLGGQHGGVSAPPGCAFLQEETNKAQMDDESSTTKMKGESHRWCQSTDTLIRYGAYLPWVRDHVVQAQYFRDPQSLEEYLEKNIFLPDANNEKIEKNPVYAVRMKKLERLVLVRFMNDTTVVPRDSSWFAEETPEGKVVPYAKTKAYAEDWIGLRTLDESNRLVYAEVEGEHLQFSLEWFVNRIVEKYFAPTNQTSPGSKQRHAGLPLSKEMSDTQGLDALSSFDIQALHVPLPNDGFLSSPRAFKGRQGVSMDPMRLEELEFSSDGILQAVAS